MENMEKKQSILRQEVRQKRMVFNMKRLKTLPNRPSSEIIAIKSLGKGVETSRNRKKYSSSPFIKQNNKQRILIKKQAASNSPKLQIPKTVRVSIKGYAKRQKRLQVEKENLQQLLKSTQRFSKNRHDHKSALEGVVGIIGEALMQKVPKLRLLSHTQDKFLTGNGQFVWKSSIKGSKQNNALFLCKK